MILSTADGTRPRLNPHYTPACHHPDIIIIITGSAYNSEEPLSKNRSAHNKHVMVHEKKKFRTHEEGEEQGEEGERGGLVQAGSCPPPFLCFPQLMLLYILVLFFTHSSS